MLVKRHARRRLTSRDRVPRVPTIWMMISKRTPARLPSVSRSRLTKRGNPVVVAVVAAAAVRTALLRLARNRRLMRTSRNWKTIHSSLSSTTMSPWNHRDLMRPQAKKVKGAARVGRADLGVDVVVAAVANVAANAPNGLIVRHRRP